MTLTTPAERSPITEPARNRHLRHASEALAVAVTESDVTTTVDNLLHNGLGATLTWLTLRGDDPLTRMVIGEGRAVHFSDLAERAAMFPDVAHDRWHARIGVPLIGAKTRRFFRLA